MPWTIFWTVTINMSHRAQNNAANIFLDYQALQMMQTEKMMEKFSDEVADKIARALRQ